MDEEEVQAKILLSSILENNLFIKRVQKLRIAKSSLWVRFVKIPILK